MVRNHANMEREHDPILASMPTAYVGTHKCGRNMVQAELGVRLEQIIGNYLGTKYRRVSWGWLWVEVDQVQLKMWAQIRLHYFCSYSGALEYNGSCVGFVRGYGSEDGFIGTPEGS